MRLPVSFTVLLLSSIIGGSHAFLGVAPAVARAQHTSSWNEKPTAAFSPPRGGGAVVDDNSSSSSSTALSMMSVSSALLTTAPLWKGLATLTGVAAVTLTPLTLVRQGYAFSVGYGFSIATMSWALIRSFDLSLSLDSICSNSPATLLCYTALGYGLRLALHLLVRDVTVADRREAMNNANKSPPLKRIPFAASVSLFYAMMTSPLLYSLRSTGPKLPFVTLSAKVLTNLEWTGVATAVLGFVMESVTDTQKFVVKSLKEGEESTFVGPTSGFYALCRHPNYLGEVLFWFGLFLGGLPHYGTSVLSWLTPSFGFYGIYGVMSNATKRLDTKQQEKYEGQPKYDQWRKKTFAMIPFV